MSPARGDKRDHWPVYTQFLLACCWCPGSVKSPAPKTAVHSATRVPRSWCSLASVLCWACTSASWLWCLGWSGETIFPLKMKFRHRISNQCHLVASVLQSWIRWPPFCPGPRLHLGVPFLSQCSWSRNCKDIIPHNPQLGSQESEKALESCKKMEYCGVYVTFSAERFQYF